MTRDGSDAARWIAAVAARPAGARRATPAAQPDLGWIDRDAARQRREIHVNADRGDRPLTVPVRIAVKVRRAADGDLGRADGVRDRAGVRAERRELPNAREARRRPRRAVRANDQADLLSADVRARIPARLHALHAHRRAPRQRADRAHGRQLVAPAAAERTRSCSSTSLRVDPGLPVPRFFVRATMKRDLPKICRPFASVRKRARRNAARAAGRAADGRTTAVKRVTAGRVAHLLRFGGCGTLSRQRAAHSDPGARQQGPLHACCVTPSKAGKAPPYNRRRARSSTRSAISSGSRTSTCCSSAATSRRTARPRTRRCKRCGRSRPIPNNPAVILLTSKGSEYTAVQAIKSGAFDYVPKSLLGREQVVERRAARDAASQRRRSAGATARVTGVVAPVRLRHAPLSRDARQRLGARRVQRRARQGSRAQGAASRPRLAVARRELRAPRRRSSSCSTTSKITPSRRSTISA